jgi:hypothetical protein
MCCDCFIKTISAEAVRIICGLQSLDPLAANVGAYIRTPQGYVSGHAAYEATLSDESWPRKNAAALDKLDTDAYNARWSNIYGAEARDKARLEERRALDAAATEDVRAREAARNAAAVAALAANDVRQA